MTPLILNLLQISILMSVVAVILHLVMNVLSNSIPPKWKYYVWGIVLVSFLLPFRPKIAEPIVTVDAPSGMIDDTVAENAVNTAESSSSFWSQIDMPVMILCVWLAGIVVFLGVVLFRHLNFMRTAKRWGTVADDIETMTLVNETMADMNISTDIDVIRSKMVSVPMMAGVFKPVLFLPEYDLDKEELSYVIRHELVHYRKFDIMLKLLSVLANAVHWFNPLVYLMQRWIHTDCEVACDYEVTKSYEHEERVRYVETIIGVAKHEVRYKTMFSTNFYDGKKTMKKRLESVLSDNKTRNILVVIVVAALVVTCIIAGSAMAVSTGDENIVPYIGEKKAKEIALKKTGGGDLMSFSFDDKTGSRVYSIEIADKDYEYKITMDATSGDILSYDKTQIPETDKKTEDEDTVVADTSGDSGSSSGNSGSSDSSSSKDSSNSSNSSSSSNSNKSKKDSNTSKTDSSSSLISASKAKSIALDRVGGGTVTECKLDTDDGVKIYEVKIIYNGYEYEVDINAQTGKIIDFDKDEIDDDDD